MKNVIEELRKKVLFQMFVANPPIRKIAELMPRWDVQVIGGNPPTYSASFSDNPELSVTADMTLEILLNALTASVTREIASSLEENILEAVFSTCNAERN